jgi:MFS transporter, PAT family, solute carrier family 33 (acetyl-CoA transportor), member 1
MSARPKSARPLEPMGVTTGLNSVYISPRTPRTPRVAPTEDDDDDVEMELLRQDERDSAQRGLNGDGPGFFEAEDVDKEDPINKKISAKDKRSMVLLSVLCELFFRVSDV